MFALRCTKKLLDCIPGSVSEPGPSDTLLGDWYANLHESNPPVILLVSERTLLPIVVLRDRYIFAATDAETSLHL